VPPHESAKSAGSLRVASLRSGTLTRPILAWNCKSMGLVWPSSFSYPGGQVDGVAVEVDLLEQNVLAPDVQRQCRFV